MVLIPNAVRIGALRWFGASIGPGVLIRHRVRVASPSRLTIGADSWIGENVHLDNTGPISIGSNVVLSQSACLVSPKKPGRELVVEDGAWIALRAVVVGPATIGRRAVVGAAATVQTDVPAGKVIGSSEVVKVVTP
ncbi:acetyltransferase [Gordonia sp. WA4-43]|nr:acetyltransferase [Gordonia sp. WA4-43]